MMSWDMVGVLVATVGFVVAMGLALVVAGEW